MYGWLDTRTQQPRRASLHDPRPPPLEAGGFYQFLQGFCTMIYRELRCRLCNKKLGNAAGTYRLAVKCPRCKHLNEFKAH